jgi:hypothetical protein
LSRRDVDVDELVAATLFALVLVFALWLWGR